ncbi:MAG: CDP-alcohol phosphatidyltransferase family protein [Gammaproteobacteria bacterium]|nr:CDP-alcohol phosphatidyltransferase family protein [Gammaproteobacteria bacterium]
MNLPNTISLTRFLLLPLLLWLAWHGYKRAFLLLLALSFFSDVLDGWIARRFDMQTELGARLDSWSDFFNYSTMVLGGCWLWPDIMYQERIRVAIVVASFVLPVIVGLIRFRCLTSYHTWSVKLAVLLVGGSGLLMFANGTTWPFYIAVPFSVLAAADEILITLLAGKPHSNTPSFWHALRQSD